MDQSITTIVAYAIATIIPLAVLYFFFSRDTYQTGSPVIKIASFVWGALVLYGVSVLNRYLYNNDIVPYLVIVQWIAPIEEEILKAAVLMYFFRRADFTYFVDGAIYGLSIGMGFAIVENYQYIGAANDALGVAIGRVISTNLIHASATAVVGIAFGRARFEKGFTRVQKILIGLSLAMALHIGFNNLVTRVTSGLLLIYAAVVGIGAAFYIYRQIQEGLALAKIWIEEKLGAADRVTGAEANIVNQMADADDLLEPLKEAFGEDKANDVHRFLLLQARLGILRNNLDTLQEDHLIESTNQEIKKVQDEMNDARRAVGTYTMSYLRGMFPEGDSPLWSQLENTIEDRIASQPAQPGGGLWGALDVATQTPPTPPQPDND